MYSPVDIETLARLVSEAMGLANDLNAFLCAAPARDECVDGRLVAVLVATHQVTRAIDVLVAWFADLTTDTPAT